MSDSKINLVAHIHPFAPSERIERELDPGMTVQEIVASLDVKIGNPVVYIDGERVIHEAWPFRKAHEGQHVLVKVIPAGTDVAHPTNGKDGALRAMAFLGGIVTMALGAVVMLFSGDSTLLVGGAQMFGWAFSKSTPAADGVTQNQVLSLRGGSNQTPSLGTKIPVILGKHLVTPYYAARPYTNISTVTTAGDTQHLRMLFCLGLAPLRVSAIKIGENLLASNSAAVRNGALTCDGIYTDVSAEIYQDGTNPTLYPFTTIEEQPGIELKSGVEHWLTSAKNTDRIHVDVTLQSGLYQYNDSGTKLDHSVTVEVRRRAVGSGTAWASCTLVGTFSLTAKLAKTLRYDILANVTAGQYEVGMKRITADDDEGSKKQSVVTWSAFRSQRTAEPPVDAAVRSKYVFLALYIKATSQLSGVVSKLNCICESETPVWNGSTSGPTGWTGTGFSQNPAALYLWALRGGMNPRPIADANIDWARIEALYTTCASKGWTCNAVVASETRLRDMLNKIGSTARSTFTMRDGKYSVVVDEVKTNIVQHFTPRNVKNFSWSKGFADLPYGALINFISATDGYDSNQRIVPYDGYTEAQAEAKLDEFDLWGVTDPALVYKQGRYRLAVAKLRPEIMSFETDAEGIVCEPGDLVVVSHDAIVVGHGSGRVKSVTLDGSNNAIGVTTDELLTMAAGQSYGIRFRRASDGGSVYTTITTVVGETNSLSFAVAIPAANKPAVGDLFTFGTAGIETARSIVAAIESMEDLACKIYVVDEAPGVHTADSGVIPEFNSRVSPPASAAIIDVVDEVSLEVRPVDTALEAATIAALSAAADAAADAALAGTTLRLSAQTIVRSRTSALLPAALTVSALTQASAAYAGRFRIELSHDGITYQSAVYNSSADESSKAYTVPATMVVSTVTYFVASIRVSLFAAGGTTKLLGQALCAVAADPSTAASHLGIGILSALATKAFAGATVDEDGTITTTGTISQVFVGDTVVNYAASGGVAILGLYKWNGTAWVKTTAIKDLVPATNDLFGLSMAGITIADATIVSLLIAKQILAENVDVTGQLTVRDGGRTRYETGSGVQKRCIQTADDRIDFLDTPDTSPATPEQLRARIGRLGVGPHIIFDGDFAANIDSTWASGLVNSEFRIEPCGVQRANGTCLIGYWDGTDGKTIIYNQEARTFGSTETTVDDNATVNSLFEDIAGVLHALVVDVTTGDFHERIFNDSTGVWGARQPVTTINYDRGKYIYFKGALNIVFQSGTSLVRSSWNGTTLGSPVTIITGINAGDITTDLDGVTWLFYSFQTNGALYKRYSTGDTTWSAAELVTAGTVATRHVEVNAIVLVNNDIQLITRRVGTGLHSQTIEKGITTVQTQIFSDAPPSTILATLPYGFQTNTGEIIVVCEYYTSALGYEQLYALRLQRYAQIGAGIVENDGTDLTFGDGTVFPNPDRLIFGSNFRGSNPFTDFNAITKSGFYYTTGSLAANNPLFISFSGMLIHTQRHDADVYANQIAIRAGPSLSVTEMWTRTKQNGTWTTWVRMFNENQETGTFTPSYYPTEGAFGAMTYALRTGKYTKIGNIVHYTIDLGLSAFAIGTGTGTLRISGLPFITVGSSQSLDIGYVAGFSATPPSMSFAIGADANVTLSYLATTGTVYVPVSAVTSTTRLIISGTVFI